jgi:hypothetical protein
LGDADHETDDFLIKLQQLINQRILLSQRVKPKNVPWETGDYNELAYLDLASRISSGCTTHLLKKIEDSKSGTNATTTASAQGQTAIPSSTNNLQIESIVGLFQPPVAGAPVSGPTDVAMCIHMVERVYAYPNEGSGAITTAPDKNVTNVNWESLFTLLYAMLVACQTSNIKLVENDSSTITLEVSKHQMWNHDSESKNFENTLEALLERSNESNFFRLIPDSDPGKFTIELITEATSMR